MRVSMPDVRTFLLFFAGIVCSTNPDGHGKVDKESNGPMILSHEAQCTHIF